MKAATPSVDARPRQQDEVYRQLFEQSPVGVFFYDQDLVIVDVNDSLCKILRSSTERLVGLDLRRLADRRPLPAIEDALEGHHGHYEGQYRTTTSEATIWVTLRTVPLHDEGGRPMGGVGMVEDVTERKEIEHVQDALYQLSEAAHSAEDLESLFESIHEVLQALTPVNNIYVALYDEADDTVTFPYFVDENDQPPPPVRGRSGITEYVIKTGTPLLATPAELEELVASGDVEVSGSWPCSWLGVPLKTDHGTIGAVVLQSYSPDMVFTERDSQVLTFVAGQVGMAIERHRHRAEVEQMAYYDSLTGLNNRRTLHEKVEQHIALASRHGWNLSLLYLDLDRFKVVNDTLGHDAGDALLVQIADALRGCLRRSDTLSRLGGDEFAFSLNDADERRASAMAQRVLEVLERPFEVHGQRVHIGGSVGIATYPRHGTTLDELLRKADTAMYHAKAAGCGYSVYDSDTSPYNVRHLEIEAGLREALDSAGLVLHYQPILHLGTGEVTTLEALVRWPREGELLTAGEFVPIAEEADLIRELDRQVLAMAFRQARPWLEGSRRSEIAINVSARSLHHADLLKSVLTLLAETGLRADRFVLEITEGAGIRNPESAFEALRALKSLGFKLAIDDFGSGFASLTYLRNMPFDRVKIDRGLVRDIGRDDRGEQLVQAAIGLGLGLGMEVVCEGVESAPQRDWLRSRGCQLVQGFLVGSPCPFDEAVAAALALGR